MSSRNMKLACIAIVILAASTSGHASELDPTADVIRTMPKMELGQAVRMFMLNKGTSGRTKASIMWDYQANNDSIIWQDDAFTMNTGATRTYREGLMRITVDGVSPALLTNKVKELAWTVTLWTDSAPKFGIEGIEFHPGREDGKHSCFGSAAYHCTFNPLRSLQKAGIKVVKVCSRNEGSQDSSVGYRLITQGKEPTLAALETSGGSGGTSTSLTLYFSRSEGKLCAL